MNIVKLIKGLKILDCRGDMMVDISSLSQKVEDCKNGCLFFCYKGVKHDGHDHVKQAVKNGAICIVCERFVDDCEVLQIRVKNVRDVMLKICNNFYNNVLGKLKFIGVTGTNGKTTCTTIIKNILENSDKRCCLIGTNGVEICGEKYPTNLTTPDTVKLFEIFNMALNKNAKYIVMEVSAHALDLKKIKGIKFEVGIFTNLTQDHLDYFKTMHNYAITKLKFLQKTYCKNVVVNTDDKYGKLFVKLTKANVFDYGVEEVCSNFATELNLTKDSSTFLVNAFDSVMEIKTNLICKFNVYNILACCVASKILGVDNDCIVEAIKKIKDIDGRLNFYKLKNEACAVIDYAHTPDGLEKVLENLKTLNKDGRLITIFGCGGNRDRDKRHKMGEIASYYSDIIFLTNDNPRWEDENEIIKDILAGIKKDVFVDANRERTIEKAISIAKKGDLILIAGKGNENYQEIKGVKYSYSDLKTIEKYLCD